MSTTAKETTPKELAATFAAACGVLDGAPWFVGSERNAAQNACDRVTYLAGLAEQHGEAKMRQWMSGMAA